MLSSLFYTISFTVSIIISIFNISFGLLIVTIVLINRQCRTVTNLLICHTAVATSIYSILQIVSAIYALRNNWLNNQPACVFRAYCYVTVCIIVSGSYAVQSLSRLFFAVLYKHSYLLSWRIHWFMIGINYFVSILGPLAPIFIGKGYGLEVESRLCMATTKVLYSSMLAVVVAYVIPLTIVIIVYSIIYYHARQSSRRIVAFAPVSVPVKETNSSSTAKPNLNREIKLMRNILALVSILVCAGIPYLVMVLWHATTAQPPPEPFYLLTMVNISVFFLLKMVVLFFMNKEVKNITMEYLPKFKRV